MNLFIPLSKERFRLLKPIPIAINDYTNNKTTPNIPAGSIISFPNLKIRRGSHEEEMQNVSLRTHYTDPRFTMRMYSGKASYGHNFSLSLKDIRELEVELVKDMP